MVSRADSYTHYNHTHYPNTKCAKWFILVFRCFRGVAHSYAQRENSIDIFATILTANELSRNSNRTNTSHQGQKYHTMCFHTLCNASYFHNSRTLPAPTIHAYYIPRHIAVISVYLLTIFV